MLVKVQVVQTVWTFYIVFDAVARYVRALSHKVCPIGIQIRSVKVAAWGSLLFKLLVIVWTDNNPPVCSAEVYIKGGEDSIVIAFCCTLNVEISKRRDKLPAIELESTLVIIIRELIAFDGWVIKAEFQSVLHIKAKDFCAFTSSVFKVSICKEVSIESWPV